MQYNGLSLQTNAQKYFIIAEQSAWYSNGYNNLVAELIPDEFPPVLSPRKRTIAAPTSNPLPDLVWQNVTWTDLGDMRCISVISVKVKKFQTPSDEQIAR